MSSRLEALLDRGAGRVFLAEVSGPNPVTRRFANPGEAARCVHDAVWASAVGASGSVSRSGAVLARFTKIADRAIEVRNLSFGTVQYEYNPTPVRPAERHWSPVWPPQGITYHDTPAGTELA